MDNNLPKTMKDMLAKYDFASSNADVVASKKISAQDVIALRAGAFKDGVISLDEANALFALNDAIDNTTPEWGVFFVEAMTDYVVHQEKPEGYISAHNADWLIGKISHDGVVDSEVELELLIKVLEASRQSPEHLASFALEQVKMAVLEGEGPLANSHALDLGKISAEEVQLLRRIMYAFGSEGNMAISRAEAEVLFDLNDKMADADNDAEWCDLFVKAVANFLMAASDYQVPDRQTALRREAFMNDTSANVGGFFSRMFAGGLNGMMDAFNKPLDTLEGDFRQEVQAMEIDQANAERIEHNEAEWLASRIGRDGMIHENERALLRFIAEESGSVHPKLKPLLEKVA